MSRGLLMILWMGFTAPLMAAERAILVLDASGSMWGQIEGVSKVEIARETVAAMLAQWPADAELGLVAYGHNRKGDCSDIETLIQPGPLDANAFQARVNSLNPKGKTPLSASVKQAAEALKYTEDKATVILVSDGEETCELNPCQVGQELESLGVDFTAHVVGFDIDKPEHQAQLRCLAENTGGRYFNARDAEELGGALSAATKVAVEAPPPPAEATLMAQESGAITTEIEVEWTGPADTGDYITVVKPDAESGAYLDYDSHLLEGQVARFNLPTEPGEYELRYMSPIRDPAILARRPISVSDQTTQIIAPSTAPAGGEIDIRSIGPSGPNHWVGFAEAGSDSTNYVGNYYYRPLQNEVNTKLKVPGQPGQYELRYVLNENQTIAASVPIEVVTAQASVQAPDAVMAGDLIQVQAMGPVSGSHWIGFAEAGSGPENYVGGSYERPQGPTSNLNITAPTTPGEYEVRYVLNENESVVARQTVQVLVPEASMTVPETAGVGQSIEIPFEGPKGQGHWIGIVPKGADIDHYMQWSYVIEREAVTLTAPDSAGEYDVVFVFDDAEYGEKELARVGLVVQ